MLYNESRSFEASSQAPRAARLFVTDVLARLGVTMQVRQDAALLTSELVTNAVMYGKCEQTEVGVGVDEGLTVWVTDENPTQVRPADKAKAPGVGGRGLRLVEALADGWGITPLPSGKKVWFSMSLPTDIGHASRTSDTS